MKQEHYDYIKEEFEDLFHSIANHITGDWSVSHEDIVQAMWISVYDAIDGFTRQGNGKNGTVDEFIKTPGFRKYLKTVLWNFKNKFGADTARKYKFQRDSFSIDGYRNTDNDEQVAIMNLTDKTQEWAVTGELAFRDLVGTLDPDEKLVMDAVLDNPHHMMGDGRINLSAVAKITDLPVYKIKNIFGGLQAKIACVNE